MYTFSLISLLWLPVCCILWARYPNIKKHVQFNSDTELSSAMNSANSALSSDENEFIVCPRYIGNERFQ